MIKLKVFLFLLVSFFLFFRISGLSAQDKLSVGISGQMHNTRIMTDYVNPHTKGAFRPTSIVYFEYDFGKKWSLHSGLGYTMMTQNSEAFKNNFHYLTMPIYLKIGRIQDNKRFAFTSFFGTNVHYLLKAQHVIPDGPNQNIMNHCQSFQYDFTVGAGIKYKLSDKYTLEALYSISIGTMINKNNAAYFDANDFNSGFMLNLSYKLK
jgi:opacity protein-like surface antigen